MNTNVKKLCSGPKQNPIDRFLVQSCSTFIAFAEKSQFEMVVRAYLIIVIFGTPTYFSGLKKYAKKCVN